MKNEVTLALSTATPICSVLLAEGATMLASRTVREHGKHAELLPELVQTVLSDAGKSANDISAVLFENGPGSYTGLRIGLSFLKGYFFQRPVKAIGINTLAAIGAFVFQDKSVKTVHAVLDARRNHVYHQKFSKSGRNYVFSETVIQELEHVRMQLLTGNVLAGTGVQRFKVVSEGVQSIDILPNYDASALVFAKDLFGLCKDVVEVDLEVAEPFYLGAPV